MDKTYLYKRILIVGDAGRGKSTFAENLSNKIHIPHWSTDDFYWKVKFSIPNDRAESIEEIRKIYEKETWIVDGGTRHLIIDGLEKADVTYLLEFSSVLLQYYFLIKRNMKRRNERLSDLWGFLKHVTYKRYKKEYRGHVPPLHEMLVPYKQKVIRLNSMKKINTCLSSF